MNKYYQYLKLLAGAHNGNKGNGLLLLVKAKLKIDRIPRFYVNSLFEFEHMARKIAWSKKCHW